MKSRILEEGLPFIYYSVNKRKELFTLYSVFGSKSLYDMTSSGSQCRKLTAWSTNTSWPWSKNSSSSFYLDPTKDLPNPDLKDVCTGCLIQLTHFEKIRFELTKGCNTLSYHKRSKKKKLGQQTHCPIKLSISGYSRLLHHWDPRCEKRENSTYRKNIPWNQHFSNL